MRIRKVLKILGYVMLGIILFGGILIVLFYYQYLGKYPVNAEKYKHNVGHIDATNADQPNKGFELCGTRRLVGSYHSAAPRIYRGSKRVFVSFILSEFDNKGYTDSGILNFRFHINCDKQVGNLEINQLNLNYEKTQLTQELVDQLTHLVVQSSNWEAFGGKDDNYYMYLNFKIEDGNITEIIP